jgi:hypothetical protein
MVTEDEERVVIVFGAGATKACGGPLTLELLPRALDLRETLEREGEGQLAMIEAFLHEHFHLPASPSQQDFPDLPLLLSLIDTARVRGESFGSNWESERLDKLRESLEYAIFALLEHDLRVVEYRNPYRVLLEYLFAHVSTSLTVISLNYDIIVDNVLSALVEGPTEGGLPNYECDIATSEYRAAALVPRMDRDPVRVDLLKLHGSLNWMHCPNCHRLDLGVSESGRSTVKVLSELWETGRALKLAESFTRQGRMCEDCESRLRALIITPTAQKDYGNPHIARIWYAADRALRRASRVAFVGYSLPYDDVEVAYLLKRGLSHLDSSSITVVEHAQGPSTLREHEAGRRYRNLFGSYVDWYPEGFVAWASEVEVGRAFVQRV